MVCGLGPDLCGSSNCLSSCDQKSECDPGWSVERSTKEKCALNVCCSKFGVCGDSIVKKPSAAAGGTSTNQKTIGEPRFVVVCMNTNVGPC